MSVLPLSGTPKPHAVDERAHSRQGAIEEWRREWRAGFASLVGTALCMSLWPSVSSLFVQPLQDEFGWSRGQVAFAFNASIIVGIAAPLFGRAIDRIGARTMLLVTMILTACGYLALAAMNGSLALYYLLYLFTTTVGICTSGLTFTRVVSAAFVRTRGLALAVTRSGISFAGAVAPPVMYLVIDRAGWRAGFVLLAALIVLVAFPVAYAFVRSRPSQTPNPTRPPADGRHHMLRLLRDYKIWLLCAAGALSFAPGVSLLQQLHPLLVGKGVAPTAAASMVGVVGAAAFAGTLLSGALLDRVWGPFVGLVFTVGPAIGCLFLLPEQLQPHDAMIAAVLIGLGQGAEIDIIAYMVARYFGLKSYASIYGLGVFSISVMCAVFANIIAQSYDRTGSYFVGLGVCAAAFICAAGCYLAMGPYPRPAAVVEEG